MTDDIRTLRQALTMLRDAHFTQPASGFEGVVCIPLDDWEAAFDMVSMSAFHETDDAET